MTSATTQPTEERKSKIEPRLLTVKEAAQYLNLSARTLYNRCAPGSDDPFPVRPKRVGRALRFDRRDLDEFIENL